MQVFLVFVDLCFRKIKQFWQYILPLPGNGAPHCLQTRFVLISGIHTRSFRLFNLIISFSYGYFCWCIICWHFPDTTACISCVHLLFFPCSYTLWISTSYSLHSARDWLPAYHAHPRNVFSLFHLIMMRPDPFTRERCVACLCCRLLAVRTILLQTGCQYIFLAAYLALVHLTNHASTAFPCSAPMFRIMTLVRFCLALWATLGFWVAHKIFPAIGACAHLITRRCSVFFRRTQGRRLCVCLRLVWAYRTTCKPCYS